MIQTETQKRFITLTLTNKKLIYGIIKKYCADTSYWDDLYHDIILRAWKSYGTYKGTGSFDAWICSIAKNTAIDRLTRLKIKLVDLHRDNPIYSTVYESYTEQQLPAFDVLSPKERDTLNLYIDGLTPKEIGAKLNEPPNRITVRLFRIKERLAKSVKQSNGIYRN